MFETFNVKKANENIYIHVKVKSEIFFALQLKHTQF